MARYQKGQTPESEWLAFAERMNAFIDLEKVEKEEDYYEQLDKAFSTATSPLNRRHYPKLAENNPKLEKQLETAKQTTLDLLAKAQRFERRRKRRSRDTDEARTSKRLIQRKNLTKGRYSRWRRHPATRDIMGIDSRLAKTARLQRNQITTADMALKRYKVTLNRLGVKQYRDLRGRYSKNPFTKKGR